MAESNIQQNSKYLFLSNFCEIPYQAIVSTENTVPKKIVDKWEDICTAIKNKNVITNEMIVFCGNFHFVANGSTPSAGNWLLWGIIAPQYNDTGTIFCTHYGNLQGLYMIKKEPNQSIIKEINTTTIE